MSSAESATGPPASDVEHSCEHGGAVRFDSQCVVIPDPAQRSRMPRVVTKSYALPLWSRRSSSVGPSAPPPPQDPLLDESQSQLFLRVPVPTFSFKPPPAARSVDPTPLHPCLVHRSGLVSHPLTRHTRSRRPTSPPSDVVKIPLRPCCAACQAVTDAALANGDAWPEYFSRAASRRRSTSVDSPRTITVAGSAASLSYGNLGVSISVDEIDKRRRASDTGPSSGSRRWSADAKAREECKAVSICRNAANVAVSDARSPSPPTRIIPATPTTPRIPEEDDDEDESELFPLPSPKRTPRTSPVSSPAGSLSSLAVPQTKSMNSPRSSMCSGDSHDSQPCKSQFLTPPPCSSSSSLSLPKLPGSTTDLSTEGPNRAPSPRLLATLPSISGRHHSRSPSPHAFPALTDMLPSATDSASSWTPEAMPAASTSIAASGSLQRVVSPRLSPTHMRLPWRPRFSSSTDGISPSYSPSASPLMSTSPKKAFTLPNARDLISDVLRGVGAMGSGAVGPQL